jgi:hypothetical protein
MKRSVLLLAMACAACSGGPGKEPVTPVKPAAPAGPTIHLVMDVGSTGTRFYLWKVDRTAEGCRLGARPPEVEPVDSKMDKLGWARWARSKTPGEVRAAIRKETLDKLAALRAADLKPAFAVAAGTGGFRDPETAAPTEGVPSYAAVWEGVRDALTDPAAPFHLAPDHVVARAMSGEDEARTAWAGMRELRGASGDFSVLEVGGATVQFAWGPSGAGYEAIRGASDFKGQDVVFSLLARDPADATPVPRATALPPPEAFRDKCLPTADHRGDGKACAELIHGAVFVSRAGWPNRLEPALDAAAPAAVYALGALSRAFRDASDTQTVAELTAAAERTCALDPKEVEAKVTKFRPERACYRAAYAAAFFRSVAAKAKGGVLSKGDGDLWVRGIAVQGKFFPDCP